MVQFVCRSWSTGQPRFNRWKLQSKTVWGGMLICIILFLHLCSLFIINKLSIIICHVISYHPNQEEFRRKQECNFFMTALGRVFSKQESQVNKPKLAYSRDLDCIDYHRLSYYHGLSWTRDCWGWLQIGISTTWFLNNGWTVVLVKLGSCLKSKVKTSWKA